jgi:hypothetical protein
MAFCIGSAFARSSPRANAAGGRRSKRPRIRRRRRLQKLSCLLCSYEELSKGQRNHFLLPKAVPQKVGSENGMQRRCDDPTLPTSITPPSSSLARKVPCCNSPCRGRQRYGEHRLSIALIALIVLSIRISFIGRS